MPELTVRGHRIPETELLWRFSRSSGPGGQSVNTSDTRVQLSYDVAGSSALPPALRDRALTRLDRDLVEGVLTIAASEHRSQWRNRQAALGRMESVLVRVTGPGAPTRRPTRPTRSSQRRRLEAKRTRSETKRTRRAPGLDQ